MAQQIESVFYDSRFFVESLYHQLFKRALSKGAQPRISSCLQSTCSALYFFLKT